MRVADAECRVGRNCAKDSFISNISRQTRLPDTAQHCILESPAKGVLAVIIYGKKTVYPLVTGGNFFTRRLLVAAHTQFSHGTRVFDFIACFAQR